MRALVGCQLLLVERHVEGEGPFLNDDVLSKIPTNHLLDGSDGLFEHLLGAVFLFPVADRNFSEASLLAEGLVQRIDGNFDPALHLIVHN